jgi:hypothetical protein
MMSMSELGRDSPTALEPKSTAYACGYRDFVKYLTLSKEITLLS